MMDNISTHEMLYTIPGYEVAQFCGTPATSWGFCYRHYDSWCSLFSKRNEQIIKIVCTIWLCKFGIALLIWGDKKEKLYESFLAETRLSVYCPRLIMMVWIHICWRLTWWRFVFVKNAWKSDWFQDSKNQSGLWTQQIKIPEVTD